MIPERVPERPTGGAPLHALLSELRRRGATLRAEGDHLQISAPPGALDDALKARLKAHKAAILAFLSGGAGEGGLPPLTRHPGPGDDAPLAYAQRRLWFLDRLTGGANPFYNIPAALDLHGPLDRDALRRALHALGERHPQLLARFVEVAEKPRLRIPAGSRIELAEETVADEDAAQRRCEEEARRPFDLAAEAPMRARLIRLKEEHHHILFLNTHHIVSDGWSMALLVRDLSALYNAFAAGAPDPLPPLPVAYTDFSRWQRGWLSGERLEREIAYWEEALAGAPPVLDLPADRPRPKESSHRGGTVAVRLPAATGRRLHRFAEAHGATPFMVLLALFQLLLFRLTGRRDLLVGSPVANRRVAELEGLVGLFANTLALRGRIDPEEGFAELLARVRGTTLGAQEHQDLPFEMLVERLNPQRSLDRMPLVQVAFALQNAPQRDFDLRGLAVNPRSLEYGAVRFDLEVHLWERAGEPIQGSWIYATDLFERASVERWARHFERLLEAALADPLRPVGELPLITAAEREALLRPPLLGANEPLPWPNLTAAFAATAAAHPDAEAVACGDQRLTYRELEQRARTLAVHLRAAGVDLGTPVAVALERGVQWPVAILGVLMAGGCYVPVDPDYPAERRAFIVADSGAPLALVEAATEAAMAESAPRLLRVDGASGEPPGSLPSDGESPPVGWVERSEAQQACTRTAAHGVLRRRVGLRYRSTQPTGSSRSPSDGQARPAASDPWTPPALTPSHPAYVIYTSGTSGRPKGVTVSHGNVLRLFQGCAERFDFRADDVWSLFHSFAFDFSVWELWGALLHGARVVVVPHWQARSPEDLLDLLADEGVSVLSQTPTAFRHLMHAESGLGARRLERLRTVVFGGEALLPAALAPWVARYGLERPALINMYGITETTVHVIYHRITAADLEGAGSPIGTPLPHLAVALLDPRGNPVPDGVAGELVVWGGGVAAGYRNRPELTAERFVAAPQGQQGRAYRSGDLARRRADGVLEYLGRGDDQVNLRGFRIEPGEVEAALCADPRVASAAVVVREVADGEAQLVAYAVPAAEGAAPLRRLLADPPPFGAETGEAVIELPDGLAVYGVNHGETAFVHAEIFERGVYRAAGVVLPDGARVVDAGANIGLFSLSVARQCRDARIWAFEPIPSVRARLAANLAIHGIEARIFEQALSDHAGRARFTFYPGNSLQSGCHATAEADRALIAETLRRRGHEGAASESLLDRLMESEEIDCPLVRLSEVIRAEGIERIDLLKVDVERSEAEVLDGIDPEHWPHIAQLLVEVHDSDGRLAAITARLSGEGYRVEVTQDPELAGTELYSVAARRPGYAPQPGVAAADQWSAPGRWAAAVRAALAERLPAHMVPAAVVPLGRLPLTANGKLDRDALPAPRRTRASVEELTAEPAATARERLIAAVWAELLDLPAVGRHDNFFALGGDSILAILSVSRLGRVGVAVSTREIFLHQSVAELAAAVGPERSVLAEQGVVRGPVPATPIQRWFLEQPLPRRHHFNQAMRFTAAAPVDAERLARALGLLVAHHDALRLHLPDSGKEELVVMPPEETPAVPVERVTADAEGALLRAQGSFDLARPPLLRALLIEAPDMPTQLVLIAHHLVIDTVSWWVITDDLNALLNALAAGREPVLPPKSSGAHQWAARLAEEAGGDALAADRAYWAALAVAPAPAPLPWDGADPTRAATAADVERVTLILSPEQSRALSEGVAPAWEVNLGELLAAVLGCVLGEWSGAREVWLDLEGHGRPELFDDLRLERTVGWFTALYPVRLTLTGSAGAEAVRALCGQLRAVPNGGIGYGVRRYLAGDPSAPAAAVRFNYLGQVSGMAGGDGPLQPTPEPVPGCHAPDAPLSHPFDVLAATAGRHLRVEWVFATSHLRRATVEALSARFHALLEALAEGRHFPLADLSGDQLDALGALLAVADETADDPFADFMTEAQGPV
ncbi:non-ribosomal peptide synthetase [Endothiovibrio diazotrophicus]